MPALMSTDPHLKESAPGPAVFHTTHWTQVLAAGRSDDTSAEEALAALCQGYWHPLYAFVRRKGYGPEEAEDLTQEFFHRLLAKNYLQQADRRRGRFRTFLLAAMTHFLTNEWHRETRQKRGGRPALVSWDAREAERRCARELSCEAPPERVFDRRWAATVLDRVFDGLAAEYTAAGKRRLYQSLLPLLTGDAESVGYRELGQRLGLAEGAVKVSVHRLRRRFGERLRLEVAQTVESPAEIEDELRYLLSAVAVEH